MPQATYVRPDYNTAREQAGFGYAVGGTQGALREITGVPIREFNLNAESCVEAYRRGRPLLREMFGEEVGLPGVSTPAISYGHVNALGSELLFPEGGEVAHTHVYASLEEGLRRLAEPVDFASAGWFPFFSDFRDKLAAAFPDEAVGLSFGAEGPITTAYELRGDGFFTDIFDAPELAQQFLAAVVRSILDYHAFLCSLHGVAPLSPAAAGMCDDLSSFIPARLFSQFVIPAWEAYYQGMTTGARHAHVEDLRAEQLPFLEDIGLSHFDPSISPKLNPQIVAAHCRVPFAWRLGSFHYTEMSCRDVEDFVYQSAADGASSVITYVAEGMCNEDGVAKVHAFLSAAKDARQLIAAGCSREEIGQRVSAEGRRKLWDRWCGFNSPLSSRGRMTAGDGG